MMYLVAPFSRSIYIPLLIGHTRRYLWRYTVRSVFCPKWLILVRFSPDLDYFSVAFWGDLFLIYLNLVWNMFFFSSFSASIPLVFAVTYIVVFTYEINAFFRPVMTINVIGQFSPDGLVHGFWVQREF